MIPPSFVTIEQLIEAHKYYSHVYGLSIGEILAIAEQEIYAVKDTIDRKVAAVIEEKEMTASHEGYDEGYDAACKDCDAKYDELLEKHDKLEEEHDSLLRSYCELRDKGYK